jgi:hypothetical protein
MSLSLADKKSLISAYNAKYGLALTLSEPKFNSISRLYLSIYKLLQLDEQGDVKAESNIIKLVKDNKTLSHYLVSGYDPLDAARLFINDINEIISDLDLITTLNANQSSGLANTLAGVSQSLSSKSALSSDVTDFLNELIAGNIQQKEWEEFCNAIAGSSPIWTRSNKVSLSTAQYLAEVALKLNEYYKDPGTNMADIINLNSDSLFTDSTNAADIYNGSKQFMDNVNLAVSSILLDRPTGTGLNNYFKKASNQAALNLSNYFQNNVKQTNKTNPKKYIRF